LVSREDESQRLWLRMARKCDGANMGVRLGKECILPASPPHAPFAPQDTVIQAYYLQAGKIR